MAQARQSPGEVARVRAPTALADALALALAAALAAAGCARAPETDHISEVRAICADLDDSGAGASEAEALLGPPSWTGCGRGFPPVSEEDRCPRDGAPICIRVWAYRAHDERLCGGTACSYGCELRAPEAEPEETCSARFLGGSEQPPAPLP